jgi:hypothetical protein
MRQVLWIRLPIIVVCPGVGLVKDLTLKYARTGFCVDIFSCDSSSIRDNVRRSDGWMVGRMVGRSDGLQRVSKLHRMIE